MASAIGSEDGRHTHLGSALHGCARIVDVVDDAAVRIGGQIQVRPTGRKLGQLHGNGRLALILLHLLEDTCTRGQSAVQRRGAGLVRVYASTGMSACVRAPARAPAWQGKEGEGECG